MKVEMKILGIAASLVAIPLLMALPQSMLISDVTLRQDAAPDKQTPRGERRISLLGKVTAVHDDSLEIANPKGEAVTVKITAKTEFHKDRHLAKRDDFKVGDVVLVRGEENSDRSWTAQLIAARSANRPNSAGFSEPAGTLGKDYVAGEVKLIEAPKISVLRPDNVTQTIELNEETSLRKGKESITMADLQVGDQLFVRGALQDGVFIPKFLMVIDPERWKAMQEMGMLRTTPVAPTDQSTPGTQAQKPPEPRR